MFLKIVAQAFELGDFLDIFLRFFWVFEAHFLIKIFLIKKCVVPVSFLDFSWFSWSSFINVCIVGKDLLKTLRKLFYLRFCVFNWPLKKRCATKFLRGIWEIFCIKITVPIIPANLVTNSLLSFFCSFLETKKKIQIFCKFPVW